MRIPRIFHSVPLQPHTTVALDESAARHVAKVLRLGAGAELVLFDGSGVEYRAVISAIDKRHVEAKLGNTYRVDNESPLQVTLAQGVSRGDRMDFTIQKAVELGVNRIVPLNTENSVVSLKGERLEKKLAHWRGVIISACEQCGRNTLPELLPLYSLHDWLQQPNTSIRLLLDHRAEAGISALQTARDVTLLAGPEGGISERERELAYEAGYQGIRLGPRVLRTETAALTALAALQSRLGDLG